MKKAYFACGCFWGAQYYLDRCKGVKQTVVGYMGGDVEAPSYQQVKTGATGHLETTEVEYDPTVISYEELVKYFFEIHDFTQKDGQGPDLGSQYLSGIFVADENERKTVEKVIALLREKGYDVATKVLPHVPFYRGEDYHQEYYEHKGTTPYCHTHKKIF